MTEKEQRAVLEGIARDENAYPRDRIAAVKALQAMDRPKERERETAEDELERLIHAE
jgi:hypothetical protein